MNVSETLLREEKKIDRCSYISYCIRL